MCLILIFGLLGGCARQETEDAKEEPQGSEEPTPKTVDFTEHVEFKWWLYATQNDYYTSYSDNPVVLFLNEKFNMTLTFEQPAAGTETDALSIMLTSGNYTDLIDSSHYTGSVSQLYKDGVIIDIADYLEYMPNLKALIDANPEYRRSAFNDEGNMLRLPEWHTDFPDLWGGLVYRHDILEIMTGGNVAFPSGNSIPTTVEDWDYMLPLIKSFFEASGMPEFAPLILPAQGLFETGHLLSGFGTHRHYFEENGTVKFGPMEDGFYNYLVKMHEWFQAGYIYQDFASRTTDLFYLPNPALTYGGAAGVWFGLAGQLGTALSLPEHGLNVDVRAIPSPVDTKNGIDGAPDFMRPRKDEFVGGAMITTQAQNVERLLASLDFLYSKEGSIIRSYGLDADNAAGNELYARFGLEGGAFTFNERGEPVFSEALINNIDNVDGFQYEWFFGNRLPGLRNNSFDIPSMIPVADEHTVYAWDKYNVIETQRRKLPIALFRTEEEENIFSRNQAIMDDYIDTMVLKFILGVEELNEASWNQFKEQLIQHGVKDNIDCTAKTRT